MAYQVIVLPGYGGSGPQHWQSLWEAAQPLYRRFQPSCWERPLIGDWLEALDRAVQAAEQPVILLAHSLSCLLVAHWAARGGRAAGAMLVAPPDPQGPVYPDDAVGFDPLPTQRFGWPTLMVVSENDPYGSPEFAGGCARDWGADLISVGPLGHINSASGIGDWPQGHEIFRQFLNRLADERPVDGARQQT